jgi:hypothetical protein
VVVAGDITRCCQDVKQQLHSTKTVLYDLSNELLKPIKWSHAQRCTRSFQFVTNSGLMSWKIFSCGGLGKAHPRDGE